jgi:glycosyltransferase involved in cell wall biosynthesis
LIATCTTQPETAHLLLAGRRIAEVVYSNYPRDPRVRRAAEALVNEGASVEVICLKETDDDPQREVFNGVDITRIPLKRRRGGKLTYLTQYGAFILLAGAVLTRRTIKRRFDLLHVHNMPDVLVFAGLIPKLLGAKIILDLHDPMPELMVSIFGLRENSLAVRLLKKLEKWSLQFADAVLTVNHACSKIFSGRSCPREKMTVVMNSPDEEIFRLREASILPLPKADISEPFIVMYHGSLVERHGLDLAVKALRRIKERIPNAQLRIYGSYTPFLDQVMNLVRNLELGEAVRYMGPKNLEQIAQAINGCDVGIIPNRRNRFTEVNTPTRIFEYLSQGKPVIAPMTPAILDYFGPTELVLFEQGDADDLAAKLAYVFSHPTEIAKMVARGQQVYRIHKWSSERSRFVSLVQEVFKEKERSPALTKSLPHVQNAGKAAG